MSEILLPQFLLTEDFKETTQGALSKEQVRGLSRLNPLRSTLAILWSLSLGAGIIALTVLWWHPVVVLLAVVGMGFVQHGLFVLVHDAAHFRLYNNRRLNYWVGTWLGAPGMVNLHAYRIVHRLHHNNLYSPIDPDLALMAGYPRGRWYLFRKLLVDLTGWTAPKTFGYFKGKPAPNAQTQKAVNPLEGLSAKSLQAAMRTKWLIRVLMVLQPATAFFLGVGVEYLVLWVLPIVTVLQAVLRIRAVMEHGAPENYESIYKMARTNLVPFWAKGWLFPHHVNYHIEHHLYPSIPHYHLPQAHNLLKEGGKLDHAEVIPMKTTLGKIFADPKPANLN